MPIITLFNKLESKNCSFDCYVNGVTLKNQKINCFTVTNDSLWILTEDCHEINVPTSDFSFIDFDAIVQNARTSAEMSDCLRRLDEQRQYNAYLRKSKSSEGFIMGFYGISNDLNNEQTED